MPNSSQPDRQPDVVTRLTVGGVPEHFNLPWHLAIESRAFDAKGIELDFIEFPGGTGAMTRALRNHEIDLALVLTEGCIADLLQGNPAKIIKVYVASPLIWGIHVSADSSIEDVEQIRGKRYAISRRGSGSHLMAIVDAVERGWSADGIELVTVGNLKGARNELGSTADVFFWEKYTTNPFVLKGEFRRLGIRKTLWPAFVVCARSDSLSAKHDAIRTTLEIVNESARALMANHHAVAMIAERYHLRTEMVAEWFSLTRWDCGFTKPDLALEKARSYLERAGIIEPSDRKTSELWHQL